MILPSLEEFSTVFCDPYSQRFFRSQWSRLTVFVEFPCFFYDPVDAGNLLSVSSAFSKPSLYTRKFSVHVGLKPSLKDFEHKLATNSV